MKIIIADDSKILKQRVRSLLEEIKGVKIIAEAENLKQAVKNCEELKPDLIILDIRMPDGSGLDVLKILKEKKLPVIKMVFTYYPIEQYRKKCRELGADYFFDKSNDFEKMTGTVKKLAKKIKNNHNPSGWNNRNNNYA